MPKSKPRRVNLFGVNFSFESGFTREKEIMSHALTIPSTFASPCNLLQVTKKSSRFIS
jgi:hypothetical protein